MIRNGFDIANGTVLSTQVCVVGSSVAGVTVAWELQKAGIQVILIEGSRPYATLRDSWPDKTLLYNGEALGLFATNEPDFLILADNDPRSPAWERERIYGGTSAHWGGQSRPEDPVDLAARPNFPGWPVDRAELDKFYARASELLRLHGGFNPDGRNFSNEFWEGILKAKAPSLPGFDTEMYQFVGGKYRNFATRTFDDGKTIGDTSVDVIQNASLLDIGHHYGSVQELRVASMDKAIPPQKATEFTIKADVVVLACGAVANARQLLLSDIGNEHDQVGRYFMCHPLSQGPAVFVNGTYLTDAESRFMNGRTPQGGTWTDRNGVGVNARFIPNAETVAPGIGRCWFWAGGGQYYYEPVPVADSRITLADSVDPVFGQRQTRIHWQLSDIDQQTYETTTALFQSVVSTSVDFLPWEQVKAQLIVNGHHIGTARMSEKPEDGVVDRNLKVHSMKNLYVAGSGVYPTAGISNPTFTITMFSIRLADHLKTVLG